MTTKANEIYDTNFANEKLKNGTKYELITAVVFKCLNTGSQVTHDVRLQGDGKSASHQIDVTALDVSTKKRVLIECKDYDKVIGIGVIRDFYGAVHQIRPDEAIVVTTKGFTAGAIKFARDENIKLAVLREFQDADWDGLIRNIELTIHAIIKSQPKITWLAYDDEEYKRVNDLVSCNGKRIIEVDINSTYAFDEFGNKALSLKDLIEPIINSADVQPDKVSTGRHIFERPYYVYNQNVMMKIRGLDFSFQGILLKSTSIVDDGKKVAKLLLNYFGNADKKIIFEEDLREWTFDEDGEVITRT
jgi:hypothetical protein